MSNKVCSFKIPEVPESISNQVSKYHEDKVFVDPDSIFTTEERIILLGCLGGHLRKYPEKKKIVSDITKKILNSKEAKILNSKEDR